MSAFRRLRAIVLNGLVWGGTWFVGIMAMVTVANIVDPPASGVTDASEGWFLAASGGLLLFLGGSAFAAVVTFVFRGRRLSEINWMRFGLGGGIVAGLVFPAFISVMRALGGEPMLEVGKLLSTGLFGFVGGSILAAGTLKLAQLADRHGPVNAAEPPLLESDRSAPSMQRDSEWSAESRKTK
jgi:hypothetical protein